MESIASSKGTITPPRRSPPNEHAYTVTEESVFSPTTNLKLLASISFLTSRTESGRTAETPKRNQNQDQNIFGVVAVEDNLHFDSVNGDLSKRCKSKISAGDSLSNTRKEKSLGLLCHKFLDTLSKEIGSEINLEYTARVLGSGKRRMYDIINVLESLCAVVKVTKSKYRWLGLNHLPEYLMFLKMKGERDEWPSKIADTEEYLRKNADKSIMKAVHSVIEQTKRHPQDDDMYGYNEDASSPFHQRTSLINLCRRFLMLLLSTPYPHQLSMDVASALLVDSSNSAIEREHLARTRCRRMYDIANVLVGLKLVRKEYQLQYCRKIPILRYCGPSASDLNVKFETYSDVSSGFAHTIDENLFQKQSFLDILQAAEIERQRMLNEREDQTSHTGNVEASRLSPAVTKGPSKDPIKQLRIVTKNGAKFVVKIKAISADQNSLIGKRKFVTSEIQTIVAKKKPTF